MTIVEFLLARIDEDEKTAQAAREHEYLSPARDASLLRWTRDGRGYGVVFLASGRVLAECEAKRDLISDAEEVVAELEAGAWLSDDDRAAGRGRHWQMQILQRL